MTIEVRHHLLLGRGRRFRDHRLLQRQVGRLELQAVNLSPGNDADGQGENRCDRRHDEGFHCCCPFIRGRV